jgi:hypothetical protein
VFPARYELNSYIVFRKRLVSKRLKGHSTPSLTNEGICKVSLSKKQFTAVVSLI